MLGRFGYLSANFGKREESTPAQQHLREKAALCGKILHARRV